MTTKKIKTTKKKSKKKKAEKKQVSFYDTPDWLLLKESILRLYGNKCMKCKAYGVEMHIDHIFPRSKFPERELDPSNLQVLCRVCNKEKSNKNTNDYRTPSQIEKADVAISLGRFNRMF